jgi:hypothetical protein
MAQKSRVMIHSGDDESPRHSATVPAACVFLLIASSTLVRRTGGSTKITRERDRGKDEGGREGGRGIGENNIWHT